MITKVVSKLEPVHREAETLSVMPVVSSLCQFSMGVESAEEGGSSGVLRIIRLFFLEEVLEAVFVGGMCRHNGALTLVLSKGFLSGSLSDEAVSL